MRMDRGGAIARARCRSESAAGNGVFGERLCELQEAFRRLANVSANCKSISAVWRTSPRNARGFPPFGERLRELQEHFCHLANVSANCKSHSAIWRTSPRTARGFPPFGEPLREMQEHFRQLANLSANGKSKADVLTPCVAQGFERRFRERQEQSRRSYSMRCAGLRKTLFSP